MAVSTPAEQAADEPQMLTVAEVAALLRVKEETVRWWLKNGRMRGFKSSSTWQSHWRIPRSELERLGAA